MAIEKIINSILAFGLAFYMTGCVNAGYKIKTKDCLDKYNIPAYSECAKETRIKALEHPAYNLIPFNSSQLYPFDIRWGTWYLFGNNQDGIFGEGMDQNKPYSTNINYATFLKWSFARNLGHNVTFYPPLGSKCFKNHINFSVLSIGDETKLFKRDKGGVFEEGRNSFKLNFNDFKPFVSLRIRSFRTYIGWRETGNFGAALRVNKDTDNK